MSEHTVKSYEGELEAISTSVAQMGGVAEALLQGAIDALQRRDSALADRMIESDRRIDELERVIEAQAVKILALRQPVGVDLRLTVTALRISNEIERIGDLAKNISKRALILNESEPVNLTRSVERMGRLVGGRLKEVLDAYGNRDTQRAMMVWSSDDDVDEYYNSLFRELLTYMMGDARMINSCAHLLSIAKNMERIGDHCTNMAEIVHFLVTGEDMPSNRPKIESIS